MGFRLLETLKAFWEKRLFTVKRAFLRLLCNGHEQRWNMARLTALVQYTRAFYFQVPSDYVAPHKDHYTVNVIEDIITT